MCSSVGNRHYLNRVLVMPKIFLSPLVTNSKMILLFFTILVFSSKLLVSQETSQDQFDGNFFHQKVMPYFHSNGMDRNDLEIFRIISEEIEENRKELKANRKELKAKEALINANFLEIIQLKNQIAHPRQRNITADPLPGVL